MQKHITLHNKKVSYTLRKSNRARRMRLAVYCDGSIVVTTPHDLNENTADKFVREKTNWIFSKLTFFRKFKGQPISKYSNDDYYMYKEKALSLVKTKVDYFSEANGFTYNKINIKNQKTRWGSCSKKGNLNFNYKILFLPENVSDYIVVHELCHLKEFNHSKRFWKLVSSIMPNYNEVKRELKGKLMNFY